MDGLIAVGIILLFGGIGGYIANRLYLPAVTGYIIFGLILGPSFLNLLTETQIDSFAPFNSFALGIIAITIGFELKYDKLYTLKNQLLKSFVVESLFTVTITTLTVYLLGLDIRLAILLGILSMTTSPTGVLAVLKEQKERATGVFPRLMISELAMDNLLSIVLFGFATSIIQSLESIERSFGVAEFMVVAGELFLAIAIGVIAGILMSFLAPRTDNEAKVLIALIGMIALTTGIAEFYDLSPILLNISTGATIANLSIKRDWVFKVLEGIELPIFVAFLTLAGAKLNLGLLPEVGVIGLGYIAARSAGKIMGARIGCHLAGFDKCTKDNLGYALMPQAGVAIGLSIVAEQRLDIDVGVVTTVILAAVIVFEIIGPLLVKLALKNIEEANNECSKDEEE